MTTFAILAFLEHVTLGMLWGIIPSLIALYYFIRQYRQSAKDEDRVDIAQDAKILELEGEIKLLKVEIQHVKDQVVENKADAKEELAKIYNKLEDISKLLLELKQKP